MKSTGNVVADTICRTAELGLAIINAADAGDYTVIEAVATRYDSACPACGVIGRLRDHIIRVLIDLPIVGFPTELQVKTPRFCCMNTTCDRKIYQGVLQCAAPGRKVTHRVTRWILQRLAVDRMSIHAIAQALGVSWHLVCDLALEKTRELVYSDPDHLAHVTVIGVDEHKWSHNRKKHGDGFVTVIVDMTEHHHDRTIPARLVDIIPGRSAEVLATWLAAHKTVLGDTVRIVAMDGFSGYSTAVKNQLPTARKVLDPFHVIRLAGDKVQTCRQRLQQETLHRRGHKNDPLYRNRKTLLTRQTLLTEKAQTRLSTLFDANQAYQPLKLTWMAYQSIIDCYEDPNRDRGKTKLKNIILEMKHLTTTATKELQQLGRSLYKRMPDILAFFTTGVSNGPVEAINGRLEHLRGIALGFRNLNHYILRCLIHSGQLHHKINAL